MHRDLIGHGAEPLRGLCGKQFATELRDEGVERADAIEAVSRAFGVPRDAAELFILSHPAWSEEEFRHPWPWWPAARG
jgi:hypothetical protein